MMLALNGQRTLSLLLPAVPLPRVCLLSLFLPSLISTSFAGVFQRRQVVGEGAAA